MYKTIFLFLMVLSLVLPMEPAPETLVIVTTAESIPDNPPGVPVLLTLKDEIPESTSYFLEDFAPDRIYLLGDVSERVRIQLSYYGEVVMLSPEDVGALPGKDLAMPGYVVISDPQDPLYPAARLLSAYRGCSVTVLPEELRDTVQKEWKFMQWEFIGSMWGVWEYAMWDKTEDKLQWIGYRYLFTDALFETHAFRTKNTEYACSFLPEGTMYVAIVGEIGTSMDYVRRELSNQGLLVPTLTSECTSDCNCFRCDYSSLHQTRVAFSSVECLAPAEKLNGVLFQDAPKYWISSEKEREDLTVMAAPYIELIPSPALPLSLDYVLAEKFAVGRFTGYDLADTMAFIARSLFLPPKSENVVLANNIEVPVYTDMVLTFFENANMNVDYYPLGKAETKVLDALQNTDIFIYNGTGNSSFFLPHFYKKGEGVATSLNMEVEGIESHMFLLYPGNGCISFWFPDVTNTYDIKISEGFSGRTWEFTAARPELFVLVSDLKGVNTGLAHTELDTLVQAKIPPLDHFVSPFAYISATGPIGSSEFPLWFIRKGASGFCINVGMQEVLTNFEFEALFFSHALANNPVGESMRYAKNNVHTAGYWYPLSGLWMSEEQYVREEASCLFGDPAFVLKVQHPLDEVTPLDRLLQNPVEEARALLEEVQHTREKCQEIGVEVEGIDDVLTEAEKRIESGDSQSLEFIQGEYSRIQDQLRGLCETEIAKAEKRAGKSEGLLEILEAAKKAFDEERYVDCLILCSQVEEERGNLWWVLMAAAVVVLALGTTYYFLRR